MMILKSKEAVESIRAGGVIAYPTEAVYGLGCDPFNEKAVMKLLALKSRPVNKGLILISDCFETLKSCINLDKLSEEQIKRVLDTWPGPFTWIFPASEKVPKWIKGDFESIALRVIQHPVATPLCRALGIPLVSTSANVATLEPARSVEAVLDQFPEGLEGVLEGEVDINRMPSEIREVLTGAVLRLG
jgi:L-threonylcarbamoyladenylate synthase